MVSGETRRRDLMIWKHVWWWFEDSVSLGKSVFWFHLDSSVTCLHECLWVIQTFLFPPFRCQLVKNKHHLIFHLYFLEIFSRCCLIFLNPLLSICCPETYHSLTYSPDYLSDLKTLFCSSFSCSVEKCSQKYHTVPKWVFYSNRNINAIAAVALERVHQETCNCSTAWKREIWIWSMLRWWPGLPTILSLDAAGAATCFTFLQEAALPPLF